MSRLNKNYKHANPNGRCFLSVEDLIFSSFLIEVEDFRCLRVGTIISKSDAFAEITCLLNPPFIFNFSDTSVDKLKFIKKKAFEFLLVVLVYYNVYGTLVLKTKKRF
jgi:hypothetical protein